LHFKWLDMRPRFPLPVLKKWDDAVLLFLSLVGLRVSVGVRVCVRVRVRVHVRSRASNGKPALIRCGKPALIRQRQAGTDTAAASRHSYGSGKPALIRCGFGFAKRERKAYECDIIVFRKTTKED